MAAPVAEPDYEPPSCRGRLQRLAGLGHPDHHRTPPVQVKPDDLPSRIASGSGEQTSSPSLTGGADSEADEPLRGPRNDTRLNIPPPETPRLRTAGLRQRPYVSTCARRSPGSNEGQTVKSRASLFQKPGS